ncbi:unnamed protein product [Sympodiomycopsis kandeliae]
MIHTLSCLFSPFITPWYNNAGALPLWPLGMASTNGSAPSPSWRSFPFFDGVQLATLWPHDINTSSNKSGDTATTSRLANLHSIHALGGTPPGVHLTAPDSDHDPSNSNTSNAHTRKESSTSSSSSCPYLVVQKSGFLQLLHPATLQPITSAFSSLPVSGLVTHAEYDVQSARLVLCSEDSNSSTFPLLRIWQLSVNTAAIHSRQGHADQSGMWEWKPRLLAEARVQHGRKPFPIAQVAITPQLSYLACSLASGAVLLLRKLAPVFDSAPLPTASSAASNLPAIQLPKFKVALQPPSEQEPVTALGFSHHKNQASLTLYIATLSRVMRYTVLGKNAGSTPITLDDIGSPLGCSVILPTRSSSAAAAAGADPLASTTASIAASAPSSQLANDESKLLIARQEALYVIGSNGREDCFAYEEPKAAVKILPASNQIVILSPPMPRSQQSSGSTSSEDVTRVSIFDLRGKFLSYTGTLPGSVLATFSDSIPASPAFSPATSAAATATTAREDVLILTASGQLHRLEERPLRAKLDLLFRKGLFILASQVAKSHFELAISGQQHTSQDLVAVQRKRDAMARLNSLLAEIWIKYGDYLYEKGDYEGSMKMGYLKSVGASAAAQHNSGSKITRAGSKTSATMRNAKNGMGESYIIRKFLDAQRIPLLTLYLQELHKRGVANSDHTTLLLNCYTKMKDTEALDRFIRRSHVVSSRRGDAQDDYSDSDTGGLTDEDDDDEDLDDTELTRRRQDRLPFDLPTAIKVCRSANYFSQAAYLAHKFNMGDEYLRIKLEDTNSPLEAIEYLRKCQASEVVSYMKLYAGALIKGAETETTDLLIELCSGAYRPRIVNSTRALQQAAKAAKKGNNNSGEKGPPPYDPHPNGDGNATPASDAAAPRQSSATHASTAVDKAYYIPSARPFFAHFMRYPRSFRRFLETVALARWGQAIDESQEDDQPGIAQRYEDDQVDEDEDEDEERKEQKAIWNTLLEMLLRRHEQQDEEEKQRGQSLRLLKQHASLPYDIHHALILCEQAGFTKGVVYLYERLGMYEDILRLWMDQCKLQLSSKDEDWIGSSEEVLESLERYHSTDTSLYPLTLRFLISEADLMTRYKQDLKSIISTISESNILSTIELIHLLSTSSGGGVNVETIKSILTSKISEEKKEIEADSHLVRNYREEISKKEEEIYNLQSGTHVNVFQNNTCALCTSQLDLPAVHFMCKHSYHSRCLVTTTSNDDPDSTLSGSGGTECPICANSYGVVSEIRKNNAQSAKKHDLFLEELREADDPFAAVATMFSKGVFAKDALA